MREERAANGGWGSRLGGNSFVKQVRRRVVALGGGFAGINAAMELANLRSM